ncbi:MAG: esterase [Rikenellaceae bacterium]|jgi:enterochelin esterase-like enzyme|nr:esterase [Rikenellaceae bacterium]
MKTVKRYAIRSLIALTLSVGAFTTLSAQPFGFQPQDQQPGEPSALNIRGSRYPLVTPDHRVVFRLRAPEAKQVQIDLGRKYDMTKDANGFWTVTTDPQSPGFHYYSLVIDGVSVADPAAETFYGMSRMASGVEIPFAEGEYYALKDVPHGDVRVNRYFSKTLDSWRKMLVYTPPGYDKNQSEKYPVLYILHGGGEDERGWAQQGLTDLILDNLIAEGRAKPMLVVMMDGNMRGGMSGDMYTNFEQELLKEVIPFVEKTYRVKADADSRALAGLSMGGLQTLAAGVPNTDVFHYLGVFSSGWHNGQPNAATDKNYEYMSKNADKINRDLKAFFLAMGDKEDIAYENCQIMMRKMDDWGIKYTYYDYPGGHAWPVWRDNVYRFSQILFQ